MKYENIKNLVDFAPATARPLAFLRMGTAAVLLTQAFALSGCLPDLYGSLGIVQRPVNDAIVNSVIPAIGRVADGLSPYGVSEDCCIRGVFLLYTASLAALLVGWRTRSSAAIAWLTHASIQVTAPTSTYGVDTFAHIALFYCMWMPVGRAASVDCLAGRVSGRPTSAARLALRVLQVHLCIVYFSSGVRKASGEQWWNGEAIWRAVMRSDLGRFDFSWLAAAPWVAMLVCWGTLLVEIGYAFFIWPRRTRKLWAWATIGLHAGIAVVMGLWSFSAMMIVLTAAAFLVSPEPRPTTSAEPERVADRTEMCVETVVGPVR
jgi:hypothetical protein